MANTYELIASSTVGSGGSTSVDFSSIPSTFTDLVLKFSVRTTRTSYDADNVNLRFNNDSGNNYSGKLLYGTGSAVSSASNSAETQIFWGYASDANNTANTFGNGEWYIPNYAGSTGKSTSNDSVSENNATFAFAALSAGLWSNTAAINRITVVSLSGTMVQYSSFYLYGVKNA
jgi:hypothetical protein